QFAITSLNYKPSQLARSMKGGKTKLIALVFADLSISYATEIMQGVELACREYGYTLLVFNANNEKAQEKKILQILTSYQVEGVIIQALKTHDQNFKGFSLPVVSVDRTIYGLKNDLVHLDNNQSVQIAMEHLVNQGFQRILFITESIHDIEARQQRTTAFNEFIQHNSSCSGEVVELRNTKNEDEIDPVISAFYHLESDIKKAIFTVNGSVMLNTTLALKRLKLEWGKDIGLIGLDDPIWASVVGSGVTTIRQPTEKIGYTAFELLLKRIRGDDSDVKTVLYPGELIIRESTQL
ncbi:MAG: substrate-binding domain-containing protein, partial [Myroides sp.]|nr:substrate-binding domain-containing protein [Myroides sp.]